MTGPQPAPRSADRRASCVAMGSLAFAAVPFYDWFCRVTGFGGTTAVADAASGSRSLDRTITVRFDASLERGCPGPSGRCSAR